MPGGRTNRYHQPRGVRGDETERLFHQYRPRRRAVDRAALIEVLREKRIAGAGLDVFRTEPLPSGSPFWDLPNVFLTPHIGGFFDEYEDYLMPLLIENMRLFLAGQAGEMRNIVPH